MKSTKTKQQLRRLPRNNQQGFTLIELLVVISILGILAAIVTMSLVGITTRAQTQANDAEHATVQAALDTMLADQNIDAATAGCGGGASANMAAFPSGAHPLNPLYLHNPAATRRPYSCDANGQITP